jgi:hypothetical protein
MIQYKKEKKETPAIKPTIAELESLINEKGDKIINNKLTPITIDDQVDGLQKP